MDLKRLELVYFKLAVLFGIAATSEMLMSLLEKKNEDVYIFVQECRTCPPGFGASYYCSAFVYDKTILSNTSTGDSNFNLRMNCVECGQGYFSSNYSKVEECQPCSKCNPYLERTIQKCTDDHDTICSLRTMDSKIPKSQVNQIKDSPITTTMVLLNLKSSSTKSDSARIPKVVFGMAVGFLVSALIVFSLCCCYFRRIFQRKCLSNSQRMQSTIVLDEQEISMLFEQGQRTNTFITTSTPNRQSDEISRCKKNLYTSPLECEGSYYELITCHPLLQKSRNEEMHSSTSFRRKDMNIFESPRTSAEVQHDSCLFLEDKLDGYDFIDHKKRNLSTASVVSMSADSQDGELFVSIPMDDIESEKQDDYQEGATPNRSPDRSPDLSPVLSPDLSPDEGIYFSAQYEGDDIDCCDVEKYTDTDGPLMKVSKVISSYGGVISSKDSSCKVIIPEGALPPGVNKEIYFKVYVDRPNDWKKLKKKGQNIDLPVLDMGPSGIQFLKPVEIHIQNSLGDNIEDIEFQYCEGEYNKESKWLNAVRAKTREEGIAKAQNDEPHVSYVVESDETIAYYLHFTGGRIFKKKDKKKLIEATVYINRSTRMDDCAGLAVYLYEPKEEIIQNMKRMLHESSLEVSLNRKQFYVFSDKKDITIKIINPEGGWILHKGKEVETISAAYFFDPELIGSFPCQDYLFKLHDVTDTSLSCDFEIQQQGQKKILIDLKVPLGTGFMNTYRYASSGYNSCTVDGGPDLPSFEEVVLSDQEYTDKEPRAYMENLCFDLSEHIGPRYKLVLRNLRVKETVIERIESDLRFRGDSCRELCYQLLLEWLRGHSFINSPECKQEFLQLLQQSVCKAGCSFITFPVVYSAEREKPRTQSKLETSV